MDLFALLSFRQIWLLIPLVLAYALVHAGTRHTDFPSIFRHAAQYAGNIFIFLAALYLILLIAV